VSGADVVAVVGIGDDGPAGLGARAARIVQDAEVLCGGPRHLALFPEHPAERVTITADLDRLVDRLRADVGRRTVVLASGDPGFYGIGPILARRLGHERVEIVPNVGAVALAFARLGESWHDATVVSAHGRPLDAALRRAAGARKLAVLTDETNTPAAVAQALLDGGLEDAPACVFEHLGGAKERRFDGRLSAVSRRAFAALNVLVVLRESSVERGSVFGRPESDFEHRGGLITKAEVRAVSLSKLRLRPDGTLWDVGAGCGSVAVEAAGLMPEGRVYAVERSAEQLDLLRRNVAAAKQRGLIEIVAGEAPAAFAGLPTPDAVFVGGSGGELGAILDVAYDRLPPGGRVVANLATVERLAETLDWGRSRGRSPEVVQVAVSRGVDILGLTRFEAQNPVFVVTLERP
jgi:precorrin-6Y C5,15-methyltransferase (decarboxylating)